MESDFVVERGTLIKYTGNDSRIIIPEGVRTIAPGALRDRKQQIFELFLPSTLHKIVSRAFSGCRNLVRVKLADGVKRIESEAFAGCTRLEEVVLPDTVTKICARAFSDCRALCNVRLPRTLRTLPNALFRGCIALKTLTLPASLEQIGSLGAVPAAEAGCFSGSGLECLEIPDGVKVIGTAAFLGCRNLQHVRLPAGLEAIGPQAFSGCVELRNMRIPAHVAFLGAGAFRGICFPETIALPRALEKMRQAAGLRCTGIYNGLQIENGTLISCAPDLDFIRIPPGVTTVAAGAFNALTDDLALHPRRIEVIMPEALEIFERSRTRTEYFHFVFPPGYLQQTQPLPMPFTAQFIRDGLLPVKLADAACLYLFQAPALAQLAAEQLCRDPAKGAAALFAVLRTRRTRRALLRAAAFVRRSGAALPRKTVEAFYMLMRQAGEGAGALRVLGALEETPAAAAERFCREAHPEEEVDAALADAGLDCRSNAFRNVCDCSGHPVSAHLVKCLFLPYLHALPAVRHPEKTVIDLESAEIEKCLEPASVSRILNDIMPPARLLANPRWFKGYCRFADNLQIAAFDRMLRSHARGRCTVSWGSLAMLLSDTREAMCCCLGYTSGEKTLLEHWCRLRERREIPFGEGAVIVHLDDDGTKAYTIGKKHLLARIRCDFTLEVLNRETGAVLPDGWGLDKEEAGELRKDLDEMQGRLDEFVSVQRGALERLYIFGRAFGKAEWERLYLRDAVRGRIAEGLIWTQGPGRSFIVKNGRLMRADGRELQLFAHTEIRLAHGIEMTADELDAWRCVPAVKKAWLDQTGERLHPEQIPADYCRGLSITVRDKYEFESLFGQPSRGYARLKTKDLELACCLDTRTQGVPDLQAELHLGNLYLSGMNRTTNTALNLLETMAIRRRIEHDDPALMPLLKRRGLRPDEIRRCLREAMQKKSRQVTALLLEAAHRCPECAEELTLD